MASFSSSFMYDFELTRILGSTSSGGCDVGEFKTAVGKLKKHDPESWFLAWEEQAERAEKIASEAAEAGYQVFARNAYLRASNYFRAASYMFHNREPRVVPYSKRSIDAFKRATTLMDGEVHFVNIPYENGITLPGYLFLPPTSARLSGGTPVVVYIGGADATKEELYFLLGYSGPPLGYAVLCFEGPGQGLLLKESNVPLRPDFEVCASKILDFLHDLSRTQPEKGLAMDKIAVAGAATGGYFALRAATDPRVAACVAIDPFYSMWDLAMTRAPQQMMGLWNNGWVQDAVIDTFTDAYARGNFQAAWEMNLGKSSMGVGKATAMLRRFKEFSLDPKVSGDILHKVTCPVLLTGPGHGQEMYASAEESTLKIRNMLKNAPGGKVEVWVPTEIADGGLTAKIGAWALLAQKTFLFLDKQLDIQRQPL